MDITVTLDDTQSKKLRLICAVENINADEYINNIISTHMDNIDAKAIVSGVEELFGKPTGSEKRIKKPRNRGDELITISKKFQREYKHLILSRCTILSKGTKVQKLMLDINDALLIKEHGEYTFNEFKELSKQLNVTQPVLYRFMWNAQNGKLDSLMDEFKSKMNQVYFSVQDKKLFCNSESVCELIDAEIIVSQFTNRKCGKEEKIWEIIRNYSHVDELHLRILCENYQNKDLLRFFNQKKEVEVVNNREKRANLLLNGGI